MGDGVGVDVCWECFLSLELCVGHLVVLQSEALQLPRLTGQLPVHLHGCLVQDLCEETGRTGDCGTDRDRRILETELNSDSILRSGPNKVLIMWTNLSCGWMLWE